MASKNTTIQHYLVKQCKKGDRQAQNELYKLYAAAMFNICRRMMGNNEDARDVLQDAFTNAFVNLYKLKEEITFSAWLKRIVVNHCINALRKNKMQFQELEAKHDAAENDDDWNSEYTEHEVKRIMKAISLLPEGGRVVLNLYLFEGYDHKEIAGILQITESTSKAQYSKAKKKLRELLTTLQA